MSRIYSYEGTIGVSADGCRDIILDDIRDDAKAPVRLTVTCPPMALYLEERGWTDCEERYLPAVWFFDRNLFLMGMIIPSVDNPDVPAKGFVCDGMELRRFGPEGYIETDQPEAMSRSEYFEYLDAVRSAWR